MRNRSPVVDELERLSPKMFRLALRYVADEHLARDVVQQVMIKIWKKRNKADIQNLESYCMTAVKYTALDQIKKRKRHRTVELNNAMHMESRETRADKAVGNKQLFEMIKDELQKLSEIQRVVVHLRDIEGYSYKEIAAITGITMDQVKINIYRARQRLKLVMSKKLSNEI